MPRGQFLAGLRQPSTSREPIPLTPEPGLEGASVYAVDFLEPGAVSTRPVPIAKAEFQPAVQRLFVDVRLGHTSPREGTDSNLARHGRRMAGEFFRMLTF